VKQERERLEESIKTTKENLITSLNDDDFHNFLRYTEKLRSVWCKRAANEETRDKINERMRQEENEMRRSNRAFEVGRYQRSSYPTPGGGYHDSGKRALRGSQSPPHGYR